MPTDDTKLETDGAREYDYAGADEDYSSHTVASRPSMAGLVETAAKRGLALSSKRSLSASSATSETAGPMRGLPTAPKRGLAMATTRGLMSSSTKRGIALAAAGLLPSTGTADEV